MEEGWERPEHVELDRHQLERLIDPAFPGRRVEEHAVLTTGLANTNVRFRLNGSPEAYVLRIHTRDRDAVGRERDLMTRLARHPEVAVAPLIHSHPARDSDDLAYSIWGFVHGELLQNLFETLPTSELVDAAAECGRALAPLRRHAFDRCGEFGPGLEIGRDFGRPSEFVPTAIHAALYRGRAGKRLGPKMRDELWRAVQEASPLLARVDGAYSLVHADYKRSNILLRRTGAAWKVAAILDWEFAFAGPPIVDLGLFLRAGEALPAGFREAFVAGYAEAGGTVPSDWLRLSRLVDVLSQVTFLDAPDERPRVFAESASVLRETIRVLS